MRTDRLLTRWIPSRGNSRGAYSTRPDVEQEAAYEGVERVFQESGRIGGTRVTADLFVASISNKISPFIIAGGTMLRGKPCRDYEGFLKCLRYHGDGKGSPRSVKPGKE